MFWLEMSRDEIHGGGSWGFGQSLWSPSRKTNGTKWAFWESLLDIEAGDAILHLRGKGNNAAFLGFSTAAANGFATKDRPPTPGEWAYADTFYRVPLQEFTLLNSPVPLREVFAKRDAELRYYFLNNRSAVEKELLFFVIQAGRLQCLNGAYLSQVSTALARLLLDQPVYAQQQKPSMLREVSTGEQLRTLMSRIGQDEFSKRIRKNYSGITWNYPEVADSSTLRHRNLLHCSLLIIGRARVVKRRVPSYPVVEPFDIVEDGRPGVLPGEKVMPVKKLGLQTRHEGFGDGII